jgi:hypothetical protein
MSTKITEGSPSFPTDHSHPKDTKPTIEKEDTRIRQTATASFQRLGNERSEEIKQITSTITGSTPSSTSVTGSIPTVIKAFKLDENGKKTGEQINVKVVKVETEKNGHKGYIYSAMSPDGEFLGAITFYEGGDPQQTRGLAEEFSMYALHTKLIFIKNLDGGTENGWRGIGSGLIQIARAHASMIKGCPGVYTNADYNSPGFYHKCGFTTDYSPTRKTGIDTELKEILARADEQGTIPDTSEYSGYMYLFLAGKPPGLPS